MGLITNDTLRKCSDKELYDVIIDAQSILIEKRLAHKAELETKGELGIQYAAVTNEINTLRKDVIVLRLFSESLK
jgi:hypothetical protein